MNRCVIAPQHAGVGAALVSAGQFFFTAGFDGNRDYQSSEILPSLAGAAEMQCENSYGKLLQILKNVGLDPNAVIRLDHFTSSQDWLPQRSAIRARIFGRPADLASTGVAAKMAGINMLTTAAIAISPQVEKRVLVSGPQKKGVTSIASAVQAGPFVFLSGVRGTTDRRTGKPVSEEKPTSFKEQVTVCYESILDILAQCGANPNQLLRLDSYVRDINRADEELTIRREVLGGVACASTTLGLPLGARGEVEINGIALVPGQGSKSIFSNEHASDVAAVSGGGWVFISECLGRDIASNGEKQIQLVFDRLKERLALAGSTLDDVLRLDVYLRDIYQRSYLEEVIKTNFGSELPVIIIAGADPRNRSEVAMNAIALSHSR